MKWLWDEKEVRVVRMYFIRNFTLDAGPNCVNIVGWFNDSESFLLKTCKDFVEAGDYLKRILGEEGEL